MAKQVDWAEETSENFQLLLDYLQEEWSTEIAVAFVNTFYRKLDQIDRFPDLGKRSKRDPSIRQLLITKHTYLYYKVENEIIKLLNLVDTRSNPTDNPFNQ